MNKIDLIGRLTKDPEITYTQGNATAVCKFTLAVDRKFKNKAGEKEADFIRVVAWQKAAEIIGQYMKKGSLIAISGRIQTGSYEDKDSKKKVFTTDVVVEDFQFLGGKNEGSSQGDASSQNNNSFDNKSFNEEMTPVDDGDIPF